MLYLILSGIFAASSFAQTSPLLEMVQQSGYVRPASAMDAHCSLVPTLDSSTQKLNFHVMGKISNDRSGMGGGWQTETNIDNAVTDADLTQVQTWINEAAAGPFKQGTNPCDIGTIMILTENYPLLYSQDCGKRVENQNPSAVKLIAWFRQACSLEEHQ